MKVKKTIQAIDSILNLSGEKMTYIKLIKLLYLIDRALLQERGYSLTGDSYVSMKLGPVLSETYNYICDLKENPKKVGVSPCDYWENYFEIDKYHIVKVKSENREKLLLIEEDYLSENEKKVLKEAVDTYKNLDYSQMIDLTHEYCQEWTHPAPYRVSSIDIENDILYSIYERGNELYPFKTKY